MASCVYVSEEGDVKVNKTHVGSNFDDFLKEENTYDEVTATAIKRVIAFQIEQEMARQLLTKTQTDICRKRATPQ